MLSSRASTAKTFLPNLAKGRVIEPVNIKKKQFCKMEFNILHCIVMKQHRKSIEGYSSEKVGQNYGYLGKTGLNNWCICKSPKGTEPGVQKG